MYYNIKKRHPKKVNNLRRKESRLKEQNPKFEHWKKNLVTLIGNPINSTGVSVRNWTNQKLLDDFD